MKLPISAYLRGRVGGGTCDINLSHEYCEVEKKLTHF